MRRIMVSKTELLTMREQGMTNNEIANSLGIDRSTVYNYIGKMPDELKKKSISNKRNLKSIEKAKEIERKRFDSVIPNYDIEVLTERITANGVTVDINRKSHSCNIAVSFKNGEVIRTESYAVGFEFIPGLINALKIIREEINRDSKFCK